MWSSTHIDIEPWKGTDVFGGCRALQVLPDLPEFQLSLRPDDYQLPETDLAWDTEKWELESQTLKEHLKDHEHASWIPSPSPIVYRSSIQIYVNLCGYGEYRKKGMSIAQC